MFLPRSSAPSSCPPPCCFHLHNLQLLSSHPRCCKGFWEVRLQASIGPRQYSRVTVALRHLNLKVAQLIRQHQHTIVLVVPPFLDSCDHMILYLSFHFIVDRGTVPKIASTTIPFRIYPCFLRAKICHNFSSPFLVLSRSSRSSKDPSSVLSTRPTGSSSLPDSWNTSFAVNSLSRTVM